MIRTPVRPLSFIELVLLLAAMMSMLAFSIDSLIPALPDIATDMGLGDPTRAQLVIGAFVIGTGVGQVVFGPLSDSFGRRRVIVAGGALFIGAAIGARLAPDFDLLLGCRFVQGFGVSSARITSMAVNRDLHSGRMQARVGSLVFMFFVIVPALAPLLGQQIIAAFGWRALFSVYVGLGLFVLGWFMLRQPETLPPERRRPYRPGAIVAAMRETITHPVSLRYLLVVSLGFGQLIGYIAACQQIYTEALGAGEAFTIYFAIVSLISAASGFINSRLVMRLGMRPMAILAFGSQAVIAAAFWLFWTTGAADALPAGWALGAFILWSVSLFFMNGLTFGNLNALALEPMGHIAGTASAVIGALSTLLGGALAIPMGLAFDGSPRPLMAGVALCSAVAFAMIWTDRKRDRLATLATD